MKSLILDIETTPHTAYVWGLWNENIPLARLIEGGTVLSFAAKWYGQKDVLYYGLNTNTKRQMIKGAHGLLSDADSVIHFNGTKFDIPHLNREIVLEGFAPPSPYKHIDLLKTCRQQFKFPSNKLEYVAKALGLGEKSDPGGFDTWVGCMNNDAESWANMQKYNIDDVLLTEKLYERLKPWIKGHPATNVANGGCPTCGSTKVQRRGLAATRGFVYARFFCKECKSWFRGRKSEPDSANSLIGL